MLDNNYGVSVIKIKMLIQKCQEWLKNNSIDSIFVGKHLSWNSPSWNEYERI